MLKNQNSSLKPLLANSAEWKESVDELSFDDLSCLVSKALGEKYGALSMQDYCSCPYWVYKLWSDKVVVKRSYSTKSEYPLFQLFPYTTTKDADGNYKVTLGDPTAVVQMFIPVGSEPDNGLLAVREVDELSTDDPEFIQSVLEDDDEDEDIEESEMNRIKEGAFEADYFDTPLTEAKVETIVEGKSKRYVIRNVAMLSEKSKNNRKYPAKVQEQAVSIFEGIKAYADHPTKANENEPRRVKETIGRYKNVHFIPSLVKTYGDLHLVPTKLVTEYIIPIAESDPSLIGSSINVYGKMDKEGNVEAITKGNSVDLVTEPATTNSLYEAVDYLNDEESENKRKGEGNMAFTLEEVLKDETIMGKLREHIKEELEVVAEIDGKDEKIEEQDSKIKQLEEEIAKMKVAETVRATQAEIDGMLAESKMPEEAKKEIREVLAKASSSDERKQILARFEKVFEAASKATQSNQVRKIEPAVHTDRDMGNQMSEADLIKKAHESFLARR